MTEKEKLPIEEDTESEDAAVNPEDEERSGIRIRSNIKAGVAVVPIVPRIVD